MLEEKPELAKSRYGYNIVIETRIGTLVKITKKYHPDLTKDQLKNMVNNIIDKYWSS